MRWVFVMVMAVCACGGDDDGGATTGSLISLSDRVDKGDIVAWFFDHDLPGEQVVPDGSCELLMPLSVVCDPACGDGQTCAPDGTCADTQQVVSAGTLTVAGTSAGNSEIPQSSLGTYELHQQSSLLGGPGQIDITATGSADFPAFDISLDAPQGRLTPDGSSETGWPGLASDQDLALTWDSPDADSRVRVSLLDDSGAAAIVCDAADTGSLTVPGSLVSQFLTAGDFSLPGGGQSVVERYRRTILDVDDRRIDVMISSGIEFSAVPDP